VRALNAAARRTSRSSAGGGGGTTPLDKATAAACRLVSAAPRRTALPGVTHGPSVSSEDISSFHAKVADFPQRNPEGEEWSEILNETTSKLKYVCIRRVFPDGSTAYLSSTVIEGVSPHAMHRFYLADGFRTRWDQTYSDSAVLETDPTTGAQACWLKRKFPLWCAPRDYVFTRRSAAARTLRDADTFVTVSRTCRHAARPPCTSGDLIRVDRFESSWVCRPARGRDGELSATEVVLYHYEDMHLPHNIARFAVVKGMWGAVKQMEARGARAFVPQFCSPEALAASPEAGMEGVPTAEGLAAPAVGGGAEGALPRDEAHTTAGAEVLSMEEAPGVPVKKKIIGKRGKACVAVAAAACALKMGKAQDVAKKAGALAVLKWVTAMSPHGAVVYAVANAALRQR